MHQRSNERPSLTFAAFERGFVAHMVGRHPADQIVYGKRIRDYAFGVTAAYWQARHENGRSPE
jgi:hypothetical protein